MAKIIKYKLYSDIATDNQKGNKLCLGTIICDWSEETEALLKQENPNIKYTVEEVEDSPKEKIKQLKEQLIQTDYKIIKCSESFINGKELPYDIAALHTERQAIRDEINHLESK